MGYGQKGEGCPDGLMNLEKRRQKTMAFIYIEMDYDTHNITGILCDIAWYNMHNIYIYIAAYFHPQASLVWKNCRKQPVHGQ